MLGESLKQNYKTHTIGIGTEKNSYIEEASGYFENIM